MKKSENEKYNSILFQMLDWQTFDEYANYRQALLVYKALSDDSHGYIKDTLKYVYQFLFKL